MPTLRQTGAMLKMSKMKYLRKMPKFILKAKLFWRAVLSWAFVSNWNRKVLETKLMSIIFMSKAISAS